MSKEYIYRAVIDEYTCQSCKEMDGKIIDESQVKNCWPKCEHNSESNQGCRCELKILVPRRAKIGKQKVGI